MFLEKPHPRSKRPSIEHEEERAWVSFYKRVGNDLALAIEVLTQLDSDPDMKRSHLALYLCCKESLRTHKARQARNKRIGLFVRWLCSGLFTQLFVQWPNTLRRSLHRGGDIVVECLPQTETDVSKEPALAKARQLAQEPTFATAQAAFRQQRTVASAEPAAATAEAGDSAPCPAVRKAA
ncbi:hypothetical protein [Rhodoferax sediminis]|uniref:Uncharacterized protein n=1 Tax=Rhodoferax sediminis TaxID=2509614 RepID=A0A515DDQ1_9BURK|nr:hypothetical protein [Rhodoferax sediminis]QDL38543.1 hypothetical protein EUB48_15535 [Rhodoferax sediminis]